MAANGIDHLTPVTVTSTPAVLVTAAQADEPDLVSIVVFSETVDILLGGPTLTATNGATRVPAGVPLEISRRFGALWAVSTGANTTVRIDLYKGTR